MLQWFIENKGEIAVIILLAVLVSLILWNMFRNKKKGGCSCAWGGCAFKDSCHKQ